MIEKLGGEVSRGILLLAGGAYIIFPVIIASVFFLIFIRLSSHPYKKSIKKEKFSSLFLWITILIYCSIFGTMSVLKYLSFHTTFFDLGIYDYAIWNIAKSGDLSYLFWGHFRPIVGVYAFFYKLFPSAITLLLLQTLAIGISAVPLYYIAREKLRSSYCALLIVVIYFLYSPVEYNNLVNFHADHLIILLMFLGFYFLEKKNVIAFLLVCLPGLFLKEPLILSVSMMGFYALVRYRMYKSGALLFIGSLLFFFLVINVIMPGLGGAYYRGGVKGSFSYLGNSVFEIIKTMLFHPGIIVEEIINVWKIGYLVFLFVPLLLIPLLSPLSLLPALPALAISLLSRSPNLYWIQYQYTASLIAPVFIALIYGLKFFNGREESLKSWFKKHLKINLDKNQLLKTSLCTILAISLYYNVVLSPSPISVLFWKKLMGNYYKTSYVITERDRVLNDALRRFIPQNSSVVSQNMVNNSYLAHRKEYYCFSQHIESADYVVLDQERAHYIIDKLDEEEYEKEFNKLLKSHQIVFSYDGIYIFKRVK